MDSTTLVRGLAVARAALGAVLLVAPTPLTRVWLGRDAKRPAARLTAIALGAREVGIGLGTLQAQSRGADLQAWLRAGAFADATDALITVRSRHEIPALGAALVTGMATGGAALGAWLSTDPGTKAR